MDTLIDFALSASTKLSTMQKKLPPIRNCRMGRLEDLRRLRELVQPNTFNTFGNDDVEGLMHTTYICMVAENSEDQIVGGVFANNYPNLSSLPPWDWYTWIKRKYQMREITTSNTLFVNMFVYDLDYTRTVFDELLKCVFTKMLYVKYIILIIPPQSKYVDWLSNKGTVVRPTDTFILQPQRLMVYLRHNFIHSYKIRMAVVEDNDDVVPLIDSHTKRLKNAYGKYYIAEMVANPELKRHVIVSEQDGRAVGVMIFNRDLRYKLLNDCFQLECFNGLRKPSPEDIKMFPVIEAYDKDGSSDSSVSSLERIESTALEEESKEEHQEFELVEEQEQQEEEEEEERVIDEDSSIKDLNVHAEHLVCRASISSVSLPASVHDDLPTRKLEGTFLGAADSKFSCNQLDFNEKQLQKWHRLKRREHITISRGLTYTESRCMMFPPVYKGAHNGFALEVIAAWPDHEECLIKLLQAGFELFPERDYCVLCTPSDSPHIQLLSKTMVRVTPLPTSNFQHELYVVHRNAMSGSVSIRQAWSYDLPKVKKFLSSMKHGKAVFDEFSNGVYSDVDCVQSYVILCEKQIVGVVNLRDLRDVEYVTSHYQVTRMTDLSTHKPGSLGQIQHLVLSPIFQRHSRFLLQELHRLSDYSLLLYLLQPEDLVIGPYRMDALACVLSELIPVLPAKIPEYGMTVGTLEELPEDVCRAEKPYAVYMSTPMYCGMSRMEINNKIVVVGASEVGLSFLLHLIFNSIAGLRTTFNNVTLVSTHGLINYKSSRVKDIMIPSTSEMSGGYYLSLVSLATYVNVVKGVMCAIDRNNKTITVNSSKLHYDMLFLTCGTQFQMPVRSEDRRGRAIERPENVFVVNTPDDVTVAVAKLRQILHDKRGNVIVYGNSIEAYCCLEAMLQIGIDRLIFAESPYSKDPQNLPVFDDEDVEAAIKDEMRNSNVTVHGNCKFLDWTFDEGRFRVTRIRFETERRVLDIPCVAAFMYHEKRISNRTFRAINRANLIFDGALVIDTKFRTNDPNIYAAGRITKYPRRFYADHMRHEYFNQIEIGERMANVILNRLIPEENRSPDVDRSCTYFSCPRKKSLVPRYTKPIRVFARIPNGIEYLSVRKPGYHVPIDVASVSDDFGQILTSGSCKNLRSQGFFKLHLNQFNAVETILAISKLPIRKVNLTHLWGKHEALLNNLVKRFEMILVTDLFEFFSRPWTYALYHDMYEELDKDLMQLLTSPADYEGQSVIEDVVEKVEENNFKTLTHAQNKEIYSKFVNSGYHTAMEKKVLEFLQNNYTYLPMYATPSVITMMLGAYQDSPLFKQP